MADYATARRNMVDGQLRPNKITDPELIGAIQKLPRERFVPPSMRGVAYIDEDLPLGEGRHLMEPLVMARLLQAAEVRRTDVALNIAPGTGYDAAVLSALASTVVAIESDRVLAEQATTTLAQLGIDNAAVIEGDLKEGYPAQAPYDVIFISGAVSEVPSRLLDQLAEGGRLVCVIIRAAGVGSAMLFVCEGGVTGHTVLFDASTPLLPQFEPTPKFVF